MKKFYPLLFFILIVLNGYNQGQTNNWYFGAYAGITFNGGAPAALTTGALTTYEGSASISDKNGNLLFYTDGITVWNRNNVPMTNGSGLNGDPSAAQSATIVPAPGNPNLFYVFTVAAQGNPAGVCWSQVDMTLGGGLGDVVVATKNTQLITPSAEKLAAVKHANGLYVWVVAHGFADNSFYAYLVDCNGVAAPVVSNVGQNEGYPGWGYMVASSDGQKLAKASCYIGFELMDFNNSTGAVTNALFLGNPNQPYGISFSPDNNVLYGLKINDGSIWQWNLAAGTPAAVVASMAQIGTALGAAGGYKGGALQLGPDGKMYFPQCNQPYLSCINNPNVVGAGCNIQFNAVDLQGRNSILGLPPFIQSYFDTTPVINYSNNCVNHATSFSIGGNTALLDSVRWNFADPSSGAANTSGNLNTTHTFTSAGTFNVQLIRYLTCVSDTSYRQVNIIAPTTATQNITTCAGTPFILPDGTSANAAGTYTSTIPASTGCDSIVTTQITYNSVHASGVQPVCKGQSTRLNATGSSFYSWSPATGLNNTGIANPIATPASTTTYTVTGLQLLGNLIVNGDFSSGNTGFTSGYAYTPPPNSSQGQYWVSTNAQPWNGGMAACGDHTTGNGNMLLVNGATSPNVSFWCQTVTVTPNTNYAFSTWLATLTASNPAQLQFSINGVLIGSVFTAAATNCNWQQFYATWNSGASTTASICVVNQNTIASGNDFALDDISFSPLCATTDTITVTVNPTYSITVNPAICHGSSYTLPNGTAATTTGTYIDTLHTVHGCDSIITTNLLVHPEYIDSAFPIICPFDIYTLPDGSVVHTSGIYTTHFTSIYGCDSTVITNLTVIPSTLVAGNDTAICLGDTAQLFAGGSLLNIYSWAPAAGLNDSTLANPKASPLQTTTYIVTSLIGSGNLIFNGDFSQGNVGFNTDYNYTTDLYPEGNYYIGSNPNNYHSGFSACQDHTTGTGNMMIINGSSTPNTNVWCQSISVSPNTNYTFIAWGLSVSSGNPAQLQFSIDGSQVGPIFGLPNNTCQWSQFYTTWYSGSNTTAQICILNQQTSPGGNDFAIDDISFVSLCQAYDTVTVVVHYPDTIFIDTTICQGPVYTFPDGATSANSIIDTSRFSNRFGCDSTIITRLTVHPTYSSTVTDTICFGTSYTLPTGVAVNIAGIYTDTLPTMFGCDSIIITQLTITAPPVSNQNDTICQGNSFIRPSGLVATITGTYIDTVTTARGCDSVIITNLIVHPTSATTVYDTICVGSSFTLGNGSTVSSAGAYPITLPNRYGCDSVATTILTVISDTVTAAETDPLCYGQSTGNILAMGKGGVLPYTYHLSMGGTQISVNTNGIFSSLTAGNYSVSMTDNFGCSATVNTRINQPDPLQLSETTEDVTCFGAHNAQISIHATGGTPIYSYELNGQFSGSGAYSALDTGNYHCKVVDANGCADSTNALVTQPNAVRIAISPDSLFVNLGSSIQLNATSNYDPATTYSWSPSFGLSCVECPDPIVDINSTAQYKVYVSANINGNNCPADTSITVTVIPDYDLFIPNAFTPNGDGRNDFFQIFGNLQAIRFLQVSVFDRIGEKVFDSNDINFKWDGTYKGNVLPPSVFVYTIKVMFDDGHSDKLLSGGITLLK